MLYYNLISRQAASQELLKVTIFCVDTYRRPGVLSPLMGGSFHHSICWHSTPYSQHDIPLYFGEDCWLDLLHCESEGAACDWCIIICVSTARRNLETQE